MPPWIGPGRTMATSIDQIVEAGGLQPRQHRLLRARFDLEHADGVGALAHRVDLRVFCRNVAACRISRPRCCDTIASALPDRREHSERQAIDLEQAERIEVVLVPLDDGAVLHRGVFDRHHPFQQAARDDEAADVLRQVARKAAAARRASATSRAISGLSGSKPASRMRMRIDPAAVPPCEHTGQPFDLREIEAKRLAHVAHRALRPVGDERGGQRGALAAILGVDVLHHLFAPLVFEVDVDVRRLVALATDEALEQHAHPRRIDFGDAQRSSTPPSSPPNRGPGRECPAIARRRRCRGRSGNRVRTKVPRSVPIRSRSGRGRQAGKAGSDSNFHASPAFEDVPCRSAAATRLRRVRASGRPAWPLPGPVPPDIRSAVRPGKMCSARPDRVSRRSVPSDRAWPGVRVSAGVVRRCQRVRSRIRRAGCARGWR